MTEPIETGIPGVKLNPGGSINVSGDAKITFKTDGKEHVIQNITMTYDEMLEEAARREAENKALESLGIDYENFGQKPWDESMLESTGIEYGDFKGEDDVDYEAPNGDYIKSYPLINRVEVIGKNGREFVQYDCSNVQVSEQDNGRTLKVFLS